MTNRPLLVVQCAVLLIACASHSYASSKSPLTVADSIETRRVMYGFDYERESVRYSPDGRRFLIVLFRGDIARNGTLVEYLTGETTSLSQAAASHIVARLFTTDTQLLDLRAARYLWLGDGHRIAFTWNDGKGPTQVVILDLRNGALETVTTAIVDVEEFSMDLAGDRVVYTTRSAAKLCRITCAASVSTKFARMLRSGFAVPDDVHSVQTLLNGYASDLESGYATDIFVASRENGWAARRVSLDSHVLPPLNPRMAPDGARIVITGRPQSPPDHWSVYTDPQIRRNLALAERTAGEPLQLRQLWLVDVSTLSARPLWDAVFARSPTIDWSKDSRELVVRNTTLPVASPDPAGLAGHATAKVNVLTGRYSVVQGDFGSLRELPRGNVSIEVRESLSSPPEVWGVEARKRSQSIRILQLNPGLTRKFLLGEVRIVHWTDGKGRNWSGRLYLPPDSKAGERYPLVISTVPKVAALPQQFSLGGNEVAPSVTAIAQPLANRGIAVLMMGQPDAATDAMQATPAEAPIVTSGYESAVATLAKGGFIDQDRVGLIGYSRTGFYVQFALTHSRFRFAAAISSDNVNESYVQYVLMANAWVRDEFERVNGAPPFGDGMQLWLSRAPGFNADKIRTPLRMEITSGGISALLAQWELFSNLRILGKPVELYVGPDIENGSHGLLRPDQQLASMEAGVDWMDFWLNNCERADPAKESEYQRWRAIRNKQAPHPFPSCRCAGGAPCLGK